jgi:hypothetical protein
MRIQVVGRISNWRTLITPDPTTRL